MSVIGCLALCVLAPPVYVALFAVGSIKALLSVSIKGLLYGP